MRKLAASLLVLTLAGTPAVFAVQEEHQSEQQAEAHVEGTLQTVDVEAEKVVVADGAGSDVEVLVTDQTTIKGPDGNLTLADLAMEEGTDVLVVYQDNGMGLEALTIELLA